MHFIEELKRRNVFRVAAAYLLLAWLVIQVTDTVAPALNLPEWTLTLVTWLSVIGAPFALFFAWAYELTDEGVKRDSDVDRTDQADGDGRRRFDLALFGLLVVAIAFVAWRTSAPGPEAAAPNDNTAGGDAGEAAAIGHSIAVLPLINMSAVADNAYFAGGVHEEILTNLSRIDGLRVVSRTTALRYLDSDLSVRDIGQALNVRFIVEGSVRRISNHVRITVQLIDAVEDAHLWASNYDRELIDVFATQSEVAREITNALHLEIQPETVGTLNDMPTHSVKAYDLYLKARSIERSEYPTEATLRHRLDLLEAAVVEDPDFVEAWAMLNEALDEAARNILQNNWFGADKAEREARFSEFRAAAQRALDKAVSLDSDNVETLLAQASDYVAEQNDPAFRRDRKQFIEQALEQDPDNAMAWYVLAWWHRIEGDTGSATPVFLKALELDPLHARLVSGSLEHFRDIGDQALTTELFERLAQIAPEKRDERSLGEVPLGVKLNNLVALFAETADESVIDRIEESLHGHPGEPTEESVRDDFWEASLMQLRNDLDGLSTMEIAPLPEQPRFERLVAHLVTLNLVFQAQRLNDQSDQARATADHLLGLSLDSTLEDDPTRAIMERLKLPAKAFLGQITDRVEADENAGTEAEESFESHNFWQMVLLSHVDPGWVAERLIERKRRHPNWWGTDQVAVNHLMFRSLVSHPDLVAFYLQEGKWTDYLAARVPQYARHAP